MKKLLLASSALVLSAGMASAQGVSLGGYGYMGIADVNNTVHYGTRLTASARLQADHGLTFGADWRIYDRNCDLVVGCVDQQFILNTARVSVDGFTLIMGNTNGAVRSLARSANFYGFNNGGLFAVTTGHGGWHGESAGIVPNVAARENIYASYSFGDLTGGVSYDIVDGTWEIAARGSFDQFTVGVGWTNDHGNGGGGGNQFAIIGSWSDGVFGVSAGYDSASTDVVLTASYQMGEIGLAAATDLTDFGLNATYDLGGGATASATLSTQQIGAGIQFNF